MIGSVAFYFIVMFSCMGLCYHSKLNRNKVGIYCAYFIILFLSIFRYDIGNDYNGYVINIQSNAHIFSESNLKLFSSESPEPLMYILTYLFRNFPYNYIWVIGIHAAIALFFLYKTFKKNNNHIIGIMILFISEVLFFIWDGTRQGVALSIILYSVRYIEERNFKKYILYLLLASAAHYSALLLMPLYFVNQLKPRRYIYVGIILSLAFSNAAIDYFHWFYTNIIVHLPYFDTKESSFALIQITSAGYKFRIIFYSIIWSTIIFFLPDEKRILSNFLFIGAIIFILASGALNIMRISLYFTFTMALSIPIVLQIKRAKLIMQGLIFGLLLFFARDILTNTNTRGCVPYESILSDNFTRNIFRTDN